MKDRLATLNTLTYIAMAAVPLAIMIGIVLVMLRAQPGAHGGWAARSRARPAPRPPMAGEPHGVNQLGNYAGEGVAGPAAPKELSTLENANPNMRLAKIVVDLQMENQRLKEGGQNGAVAAIDPMEKEPYFVWAKTLVLPSVEIDNRSLSEVVQLLMNLSKAADPEHRGANLVLDMTEAEKAYPAYRIDYYRFKNVPLTTVLKSIVENKQLALEVGTDSIIIKPGKNP